MRNTPKRLAAAIAAMASLAIAAPGASADTTGFPFAGLPLGAPAGGAAGAVGPCSRGTSDGQGAQGAAEPQTCTFGGLAFVGPSVGQIATVIGPTTIGPAVVGVSAVAAGNVNVG